MIQQAIAQVLTPIFDPTFSDSSFGFRPGRNAHQAIRQVQSLVKSGRRIAVDLDLAKFFDNVDHDVLMNLLGRRIDDKRLLALERPGHAARRIAVSAVGQHRAARSRPRAPAARTSFRALRRRPGDLVNLGVSLESAIQHGTSSKSYWHMARTPGLQQALSNAWLKAQGLLSVCDLWCKAQGYAR